MKKGFLHEVIKKTPSLQGGYMNLLMLRKSVFTLSLAVITVLSLAGCSSSANREVAQEKEHQSGISKIQDNEYAPHKFHDKKFERNNQY